MFTLLQIRDLRIVFTKKAVSKKRRQCSCPRVLEVLTWLLRTIYYYPIKHDLNRKSGHCIRYFNYDRSIVHVCFGIFHIGADKNQFIRNAA